nr:MAG TPA: Head tail connector [Caudoviricetes sp.]
MVEDINDIVEEKRAKRASIMSETEIKEAERFLTWYRRAYNDKQRLGLTKKWDDINKYWEGDFDYGDDEDPAPNTNITNSNVEGKTALLCDQTIGIQVDPREPGDRPFCDQVRTLADFIKERNKMYRKIEVHERRREMTGTGIFRVIWDFDALNGKGMPDIEPVHPSKLFIDPAITDVYKIQEAQYIIEAKAKSIYSARIEYGDEIADAIIPNLDPIQNIIQDSEEDQYVHLMIWTRYNDGGKLKLRLVEMSGDGVILKDTKKKLKEYKKKKSDELIAKQTKLLEQGKKKEAEKLKNEEFELFPNSKYPYFLTPDMYRENTVWGKASAELILPISDQVDEIDDNVLKNARLTGNPMALVENSSGIDPEKITNAPGQMIPTNNINGFKWQAPPSIPTYIMNKRTELINSDRIIVSRFSDQMIGKQQSGVDTATESLALQNSGNSMIEHKKALLQETLSEVFEYAIDLALLNWNTTMLFRITGKNGEDDFESFNPDILNHVPVMIEADSDYRNEYRKNNPNAKPEDYRYMQADDGETRAIMYDLNVTVGAGLPNNRAYRYSIVRQSYADKAITKREYRNYLIKQLGLNLQEIPESEAEQQELGIYDQNQIQQQEQLAQGNITHTNQNANIEGLNANGNVARSYMKGA